VVLGAGGPKAAAFVFARKIHKKFLKTAKILEDFCD